MERRFNPLDPLGLFERGEGQETSKVGTPPDPLGLFKRRLATAASTLETQDRQASINKFLVDVRKNIPDEAMANQEYNRMAEEAEKLGLADAAITLRQMASDEGRHKANLQRMEITVW